MPSSYNSFPSSRCPQNAANKWLLGLECSNHDPKWFQKEISQTILQVWLFTTKIQEKKKVLPETHIYTCPNHALRLGLQWPNKNEQKKTWKTTQTQHQATTEPEISRMLRCLPPAPALPPWSTESHDCVQGWLCYRCCCCIYLIRQPFRMGFCADVPMTTSPYSVEMI